MKKIILFAATGIICTQLLAQSTKRIPPTPPSAIEAIFAPPPPPPSVQNVLASPPPPAPPLPPPATVAPINPSVNFLKRQQSI